MRIMQHRKLLYLDADLDQRLRALAARRHEGVNATIRDLLRSSLDRIEKGIGDEHEHGIAVRDLGQRRP